MILRQSLGLMGIWVALAVVTLVAADPTQEYVVSLTDQSPTINYDPSVYGNGTNSWNVSYSLSPWSSVVPSNTSTGEGTSIHWSNTTNASISFDFVGTGFTAYGQLSGSSSLEVQIDGVKINIQPVATAIPRTRPTLASASGLTYGYHSAVLTLTARGVGGVEFYGADLFLAAGSTGATYTNVTIPFATANQTLSNAFTWSNNHWGVSSQPASGYPNATASNSLSVASTTNVNASVAFSPPANTSIIIIYGDVAANTAQYAVTLDSDVYNGFNNKTNPQYESYEAVTPWSANNQVIYYATLVPGHSYAVNLALFGPTSNNATTVAFALTSVVCISSDSDGPTTTTPGIGPSGTPSNGGGSNYSRVGAIVGGVLGGMAAILIILGLCWCCNRRRRRDIARNEVKLADGKKPFEVDPYVETTERQSGEVRPFSPSDSHTPVDSTLNPGGAYNEKAAMMGSANAPPHDTTALSASGPSQTAASPIATHRGTMNDTLQLNTGPTHFMDGLDPDDPNFVRKLEVLRSLDTDAHMPSSSSPTQTTSTRPREVDAGRVEGVDTLPPDYNPAWAQRPQP